MPRTENKQTKLILKSKKLLKENWSIVIFAIVTTTIAWFLKDAVYTTDQMLQSLTQAEATVLSLFGIIVAYLLTSYDSRLDRVEQQIFDVEKVRLERRDVEMDSFLMRRFREVKERKSRTVEGCLLVGSCLVFSLLLSVIAFGLRDISNWENLKLVVSSLDFTFFFVGIYGIFFMFNRMAKEPEELKHP